MLPLLTKTISQINHELQTNGSALGKVIIHDQDHSPVAPSVDVTTSATIAQQLHNLPLVPSPPLRLDKK